MMASRNTSPLGGDRQGEGEVGANRFTRPAAAARRCRPSLRRPHPQRLPLRGLARRLALSIDTHGSSKVSNRQASLDRPVNKRAPVKGENGEFGGFREAHERNHDGSARGPVVGVSNWRTAPKCKYWRMFGITGGRKRRWRQAKRGGGELWFWGVARLGQRCSNFLQVWRVGLRNSCHRIAQNTHSP